MPTGSLGSCFVHLRLVSAFQKINWYSFLLIHSQYQTFSNSLKASKQVMEKLVSHRLLVIRKEILSSLSWWLHPKYKRHILNPNNWQLSTIIPRAQTVTCTGFKAEMIQNNYPFNGLTCQQFLNMSVNGSRLWNHIPYKFISNLSIINVLSK